MGIGSTKKTNLALHKPAVPKIFMMGVPWNDATKITFIMESFHWSEMTLRLPHYVASAHCWVE